MKTYILKEPVTNSETFEVGTIVTITDDYWGKNQYDKNTGFTVTEGELKGEKGSVADGLQDYLIDDTPVNRLLVKNLLEKIKIAKNNLHLLNIDLENLPSSNLNALSK